MVFLGLFFSAIGASQGQAAGQRLDQVQTTTMSEKDRAAAVQALRAINRNEWSRAERLVADSRNMTATKLYYWFYYTRNNKAAFDRIAGFIRQNPDWPQQGALRLAAERALDHKISDQDAVAWFRDYPPRSVDAMERYLASLQRLGLKDELRDIVRPWWRSTGLSPDQQRRILAAYGTYIDTDTHVARFDNMIYRGHYTNARAIARLLGRGYPALAEARIALAEGSSGVDGLVAGVPPHLQNDPGLLYERVRWRRRNDREYAAIEILQNSPPPDRIGNPAGWWQERHILARRLMERKNYESAYLLVSKHGQKDGLPFAQAEFLAGWLALRFLEKPWLAFEHFEALYHGTETPISRARGAYWAGRASEALGAQDVAIQWYQTAARHQTTFYGQLAIGALDTRYRPPQQLAPQRSIEGELRFETEEMVQVARILHEAGFRREASQFIDALANSVESAEDYLLVADLAQDLDQFHKAVAIAKQGLSRNIVLMDHAYPTMLARMRNITAEWALVHALIRQESAFDYDAQSHAGARGLMQLMPATAQEVAKRNGWPYQLSMLTSDPEYNIRLGSAYFENMLRRYDGSYALALAAYNAGPGRVDRWLREIGDPRKGEIDMIDWIELLPIYETRNYVQRVLEGVYVYRIKLRDVQKSAAAPIHVGLIN